nr:nucleotidyltransferase domain-containing protein [uncultured Marinifilum sp.]
MRLNRHYIQTIKAEAKQFYGESAKVWLFGSRVDDSKKGGDIDLYIETNKIVGIDIKIKFVVRLQMLLGDQKFDVIVNNKQSPEKEIYRIAKEGVEL